LAHFECGSKPFTIGPSQQYGTCLVVSLVGPLAMIGCEPRQARKGAAVAADSCAGVWLAGDTSNISQ